MAVKGYQEFPQHFPADGWVEHEPDEIWSATLAAVRSALTQAENEGVPAPVAVGVTNQRETVVLWDRETLGAAPAGHRLAGPPDRRAVRAAA